MKVDYGDSIEVLELNPDLIDKHDRRNGRAEFLVTKNSPIGVALIGACVGDVRPCKVPAGTSRVRVTGITKPGYGSEHLIEDDPGNVPA